MELKTNNQYSIFIYPFVVNEKNYNEYILKLLENDKCELKLWNKDEDISIYTYFKQNIREKVFWPFSYSKMKIQKLNDLDNEFKSKVLSQYEVTMFKYNLNNKIQGRIGEDNTSLFDVDNIEIVCFKTGICFILLKTSLGKEIEISDVLNFNNKFRNIESDFKTANQEEIIVQTDDFKNSNDIYNIIRDIKGNNEDAKKLRISDERIFTYTYSSLNKESWKDNFNDSLKENFIKLYNVLPNQLDNFDIKQYSSEIIDVSKFIKIGFTNQGTALFSSACEKNSLNMPYVYGQEYLYTYIISLYKKLYINKLMNEYEEIKKFDKIKNKLENFTNSIWIDSITKNKNGDLLNKKWEETLQLQYKYEKLKLDMFNNK